MAGALASDGPEVNGSENALAGRAKPGAKRYAPYLTARSAFVAARSSRRAFVMTTL